MMGPHAAVRRWVSGAKGHAQRHPAALKWGLYLAVVLIWGCSFILIKKSLLAFTPLQVGALRIGSAGLFLLPVALLTLRRYQAAHGTVRSLPWPWLVVAALSGSIVPAMLFPLAQRVLSSSAAASINSLTPLFTLVIGALFFGTRLTWARSLGIGLGLGGSLLVILLKPGTELRLDLLHGLMAMTAAMLYGVNVNTVKRHLAGLRPMAITSLTLMMALPVGTAVLLSTDFNARLAAHPQAGFALAAGVTLGVVGTATALMLFYKLLQLSSPVFAASNTYFIPFVALGWGLIDGEAIHAGQMLGLCVILLGVWLVNRATDMAPRQ